MVRARTHEVTRPRRRTRIRGGEMDTRRGHGHAGPRDTQGNTDTQRDTDTQGQRHTGAKWGGAQGGAGGPGDCPAEMTGALGVPGGSRGLPGDRGSFA